MLVRGIFSPLKLCFESSILRRIPEDHAIVPWLLQRACLLLNTTVSGADGVTAWYRIRGRSFHGKLAKFGEQVLCKFPKKSPLKVPENNMAPMWQHAAYVGDDLTSNSYILSVPRGVEDSRCIWRRPESERWNTVALANFLATPWSLRTRRETTLMFRETVEHTGPGAGTVMPAGSRRLKRIQRDIEMHR